MARQTFLTGIERFFAQTEVIVSKTDLKGRITYANRVFQRIAGYDEPELLGQPHSIVRHPDMPRSVFNLLWDTIEARSEIFAYVKNRTKNGDYYWVFAHVTPSYDEAGSLIGYHSNRRLPRREAIAAIEPVYATLLAEERRHADPKAGMKAAVGILIDLLERNGTSYDEFIFTL